MTSTPETVGMGSTNTFAVAVDFILIGAVVAAYLPQLRHLWKSTRGEKPSIDGLSPTYILFHALFSNVQLCYAIVTIWSQLRQRKLDFVGSLLCIAQMFAQWLCVMAIVITYITGRQRELGGKLFVPLLIVFHAFIFVFVAGYITMDTYAAITYPFIAGMIAMLGVMTMPFIILLQIVAQHFELRKMSDYGALSPRSICMQAIVMSVIAIRLFSKSGFTTLITPGGEDMSFLRHIWYVLARWYLELFMPFNCLLWVGGAAIVYFGTRSSKTGRAGSDVEMAVFLE